MALIESSKTYSGQELENIFFRPVFTGPAADKIGIRVLYNMPVPTTIHLWGPAGNVLKPYQTGWQGGDAAAKESKTIEMKKIKAETAFSAADYFSMVYEQITNSSAVSLQDLSGTVLEEAETALFKQSIAESLRMTMWLGDTGYKSGYNTFNGILKSIHNAVKTTEIARYRYQQRPTVDNIITILDSVWNEASTALRSLKAEGNLVYFSTADVCEAYEHYLDQQGVDSSYRESSEGRPTLMYHGIPIVDMGLRGEIEATTLPPSVCVLTDRRNFVLAVNTADYPETEVRMWYNPDAMENRQRAVFLAGADFIDPDLVSFGYYE